MSNIITGTSGNDSLTGTSGIDYIDGGQGNDTMAGLAGDDVYTVDSASDVVIENASEGKDRINSTVTYTLPANVEDLWLVGTATTNGTGNNLDNTLWGNAANNVISGLGGNDYIDGGAGADTMIGGTGDDTYWVDNAGDVVTEASGEGNDLVYSSLATYTLPANVENLNLVLGADNINGTGNSLDNQITGNEGNNSLSGGAGNDTINGGAGADTMSGGDGNDNFWVDNAGDVVIENSGEGTDWVYSSIANYTLPANVENLWLDYNSTANLNGTGNSADNVINGNSGNNVLVGGAGNDTLSGGNGNDTLTGGTGDDLFYFSTADTGHDRITDLASGDTIELCGALFMNGPVTTGNGSSVLDGDVQLATSGGQTTLYIGLDATPGADYTITLDGTYSAGNFRPQGFFLYYDTNNPPVQNINIADQQVTEKVAYALQLPANTFTDADGEALTYDAQILDPDWGFLPLPAWLHFNPATLSFSGTPDHGDIGTFSVALMATDPHNAQAFATFNVTVGAAAADTTPPTVVITDDTPGTAKGTVTYSLAFSETVTGLAADDFTVTNGSVVAVSGSGKNYTVTVNPSTNTEGNLSLALKSSAVTDGAGNPNASTSAAAQPVDTLSPTVAISDDTPGTASGTVTYTLDFSESVTGLASDDFTVSGGTVSSVAGSGRNYTVAVTPTATSAGTLNLSLKSGAVIDAVGNSNASAAATAQPFDTRVPTVAFSDDTPGVASGMVNYTLTFSESVTGLAVDDFTITNGTIGTLSGSGRDYTLSVTPASGSEGNIGLTLKAGAVLNAAGGTNLAASADGQAFDTRAPTATITDDTSGTASGTVTYTVAFGKTVTGLTADDFTVSNGSVRAVSGSGASYQVSVAPNANTEGNMTLQLKPGAVTDASGGTNAGTTASPQPIDTRAPTLNTFSPFGVSGGIGVSDDLIATFSEPVVRGNGTILLKNAAGTVVESFDVATSTRISITGAALKIDPTTDLAYGSGYSIELAAGSLKDAAGNAFAGATGYAFNTAANQIRIAAGNTSTEGQSGIDNAVFADSSSNHRVSIGSDGTVRVEGGDGTHTLHNVERLSFSDGCLALDVNGSAGMTAKIIGAVFGADSVANRAYVGIGLSYLDRGMSMSDLMMLALNARLGNGFSTADEVSLLYHNLLGATPGTGDLAYWTGTVTSGQFTQASLAMMAAETSFNTTNINLVGLSQTGIAYTPAA